MMRSTTTYGIQIRAELPRKDHNNHKSVIWNRLEENAEFYSCRVVCLFSLRLVAFFLFFRGFKVTTVIMVRISF